MADGARSVHSVDVDGGSLYAELRDGAGPTLVFLHYWGGSHRTWRLVLDRIRPHQRAIAYDHRGWGQSRGVPGPFSLEQLADDAQRVIESHALGDHVLVGHSMGAKVAQIVAARRPAGLRGVLLVAPAPPSPAGINPEQQDALAHAYDSAETIGQAIDTALTKDGLTAELRRQVIEDSLAGDKDARAAWPCREIVADISATVASIEVPVLVLAGSDDRVDPPTALTDHLLPHIPTASMRVLAGTGHLSPLEVPELLATHIDAFVTAVNI